MERRNVLPIDTGSRVFKPAEKQPRLRSPSGARIEARPARELLDALGDPECPPGEFPEPALLAEIRAAFGFTQGRMAWLLGASNTKSVKWTAWESGERRIPRIARLHLRTLLRELAEMQAYRPRRFS